jgi:hypothetical protein
VALALGWLGDHTGEPSFSLLHVMDPHWPYDAPPGFGVERRFCAACDSLLFTQFGSISPEDRAEVRRRYGAEVRYTDAMLGRFYDALLAGGALDHTWLIITSDHGEEFWEHGGFMHGHSLYDELLRVPLVVVAPRADGQARRGVRIDTQVRLEDVAATMLEIAGLDRSRAPDGQTLLGLISGGADASPRVAVAGYVKSPQDFTYAVRLPPWKAVVSAQQMIGNRLFQLDEDAGEKNNLLFNPRVPESRLAGLSQQFLALVGAPARLGIAVSRQRVPSAGARPEADTQRALRSLGYAQ